MKKIVFYVFILSIISVLVSGIMGYYTVTAISASTIVLSGFFGLYLICCYSYRVTTQATQKLRTESKKVYSSFSLYYRLEKLALYQGIEQYHAVDKKRRNLLHLVSHRFADNSLTQLRFRQEVNACAEQVIRNLEQAVCQQESLSSIDPKSWQNQIRQLQAARANSQNSTLLDLRQQIDSYESLKTQYKECLSENDQLLEEMDKTILAMNQKNWQQDRYRDRLMGDSTFMHQYLFQ